MSQPAKINECKWGSALMDNGWLCLPRTLLEYQRELKITPLEMNILIQLASFWWVAERLPYPSNRRLAERMGVSTRTVQRGLKSMEKSGLLQRIARKKADGTNDTNVFQLDGVIRKASPFAEASILSRKERMEENRA